MKILFLFDCVSANGGAHIATRLLIKKIIMRGHNIDIAYADPPNLVVKKELREVQFFDFGRIYRSFMGVLRWCLMKYFGMRTFPVFLMDPIFYRRKKMMQYDVVCVPSEESYFKPLVAALPNNIRKVILIHTNYEAWIKYGGKDVKAKVCKDAMIFEKMTAIGVVGKIGAEQLKKIYPDYKNKIYSFYNIINEDYPRIESNSISKICDVVRLITLARIEDSMSKDFDRMIRIAAKLKEEGCHFKWRVFGGRGEVLEAYRAKVARLQLQDSLILEGFSKVARSQLRESDMFVLLSHYEGLPNVIYEALHRGIPVASTNVGGIAEQIPSSQYGWLFPDDENAILEGLKRIIQRPELIQNAKSFLATYNYDNNRVVEVMEKLLVG